MFNIMPGLLKNPKNEVKHRLPGRGYVAVELYFKWSKYMDSIDKIIGAIVEFENMLNELKNLCKSKEERNDLYNKTVGTRFHQLWFVKEQVRYVKDFVVHVLNTIMKPKHCERISIAVKNAEHCSERIVIAYRQTMSRSFAEETKLYTFPSLITLNNDMAELPSLDDLASFTRKVNRYTIFVEGFRDICDASKLKEKIDTDFHVNELLVNEVAKEVDKFYNELSKISDNFNIQDQGNNVALVMFSGLTGSLDRDLSKIVFDVNNDITKQIEVINKSMYDFTQWFFKTAKFDMMQDTD